MGKRSRFSAEEEICNRYYNLRLKRNRLVHANRPPSLEKLVDMETEMKELNALLDETFPALCVLCRILRKLTPVIVCRILFGITM